MRSRHHGYALTLLTCASVKVQVTELGNKTEQQGGLSGLCVWSIQCQFDEKKTEGWDYPGGPVVKNLPSTEGDVGLIPGQGTKILYAAGQLSRMLQLEKSQLCN